MQVAPSKNATKKWQQPHEHHKEPSTDSSFDSSRKKEVFGLLTTDNPFSYELREGKHQLDGNRKGNPIQNIRQLE